VWVEDAQQQFLADCCIQIDAALQMAFQGLAARQDQQRAGAIAGQLQQGADDHATSAFLLSGRPAAQAQHGDLLEEAAQILLEYDHQQNDENGEESLEDPRGQL